jgi:hypothetical protein
MTVILDCCDTHTALKVTRARSVLSQLAVLKCS